MVYGLNNHKLLIQALVKALKKGFNFAHRKIKIKFIIDAKNYFIGVGCGYRTYGNALPDHYIYMVALADYCIRDLWFRILLEKAVFSLSYL